MMADAYQPPKVGEPKDTPLTPIPSNTRHAMAEVMEKVKNEEPWFGIEQVRLLFGVWQVVLREAYALSHPFLVKLTS